MELAGIEPPTGVNPSVQTVILAFEWLRIYNI